MKLAKIVYFLCTPISCLILFFFFCLDGTLSHEEEIKRIQSRVDFLQKAYLRCKSFFETEYVDGGCDLENAKELAEKAVARDYRGVRTPSSSHAEWREASEGFNENQSREGKEKNYATVARAAVQQHLERVARDLEQIHTHLKAGIQTGSFQWIDSILIKVCTIYSFSDALFCLGKVLQVENNAKSKKNILAYFCHACSLFLHCTCKHVYMLCCCVK